jgi:hypothetical protein
VRFKYDALMIFETNQTSKYRVWSTMASVNQLHAKHLASVDISASEQDVNSARSVGSSVASNRPGVVAGE